MTVTGAAVPALGAGGDRSRQLAELDPLDRCAVGDAASQGDDLLDEADELLRLGVQIVEHLASRRRVEVGVAAQHGQVRAHARQRRAQLVAGILDESALVVAGRGEGAEHAVERLAEPAHLVLAGDRHLDVEPSLIARRRWPPWSAAPAAR